MGTGRCTLRGQREWPSRTAQNRELGRVDALLPSRCISTPESDLCSAFQRDNRQVLAPGKVLHVQRDLHAPPPVNPRRPLPRPIPGPRGKRARVTPQ